MKHTREDVLVDILQRMVKVRMVELHIARHYPEQKMRCPTHLCLGQESTAAVFGALVTRDDVFFGNYRSHGHYLCKGGQLTALFAELLGFVDGCSGGMGGSMHLIDLECGFYGSSAIVAGTVPIAAGVALSLKLKKRPFVAVAFFGDAAVEEGVLYETVNFALLHKLPMVFVCENNQLAVCTPLELRTNATPLYKRFEAMTMPCWQVDGQDIRALVSAASQALDWSRHGRGPSFVECLVSRWAAHVGHGFQGPVDAWWQEPHAPSAASCPIAQGVRLLLRSGQLTLAQLQKLHDDTATEVETAFQKASEAGAPDPRMLPASVYASGLVSTLPTGDKGALRSEAMGDAYKEPTKLTNPF